MSEVGEHDEDQTKEKSLVQNNASLCTVCYDFEDDALDFCKCNVVCCRKCATRAMESMISTMPLGAVKPLFCPFCHSLIVRYKVVSSLVSKKTVDYQNKLINSIMTFLCGGCHSNRNMSIDWSEEQQRSAESYLAESFSDGMDDFRKALDRYIDGEDSVDAFYTKLAATCLPLLNTIEDGTGGPMWKVFKSILSLIRDPERRCTLHLRYLKLHPRFLTTCCNREHCFNCKTRDFHFGKTCEENANFLEHSVVPCPGCQIPITRGDGCNSITCLCGRNFSFLHEKDMMELSVQFSTKYASASVSNCVRILTAVSDREDLQRELRLARAFQYKNLVAVNAGLIKWFGQQFAPYPSHIVCRVSLDGYADGAREAASLWRLKESKEVSKCQEEIRKSIKAVFEAFYPIRKEQAAGARVILDSMHSRKDISPELVTSARLWLKDHEAEYNEEKTNYEKRQSDRFILLFGNVSCLRTRPVSSRFCYATEYDIDISNKSLTFSGDAMSAQRKGSISCYPAAFVRLCGVRSMVTFVLTEAPFRTNWLTMGLVTRAFTENSSDGVGKSPQSWGVSDDRSHNAASSSLAKICSCGVDLGTCAKLSQGDKVQMFFESSDGWLEIFVNHDLVHKFTGIPPCTEPSYYYWCVTFATDHVVTILPEANYHSEPIRDELNWDHSSMMASFKRRLKKLYYSNDLSPADNEDLQATARYVAQSADNSSIAIMRAYQPHIENIINKSDYISSLTWKYIYEGACYLRAKALEQEAMQASQQSRMFVETFGDDANFVAAALLHQKQKMKYDQYVKEERLAICRDEDRDFEERLRWANSYVAVFPAEIAAWYEYNDSLSDPLFLFDTKCKCLPRHLPGKCHLKK